MAHRKQIDPFEQMFVAKMETKWGNIFSTYEPIASKDEEIFAPFVTNETI